MSVAFKSRRHFLIFDMKKIILLLLLVLLQTVSYANLSIDPYKIEMKIDKNSSFGSSWLVKNNYDRDIELEVTVSEWGSYKGNKDILVGSWLKISPAHIRMKKGESAAVDYSVKTNASMEGSMLAQVSFAVLPEQGGNVTMKISTPVHAIIRGTEKVYFDIETLSIVPSSTGGGINKLNITIRNGGNILIKPFGEVKIYDKKKKVVSSLNFESDRSVFTDSSDVFSVQIPLDLPAGKYTVEVNAKALGYESAANVKKAVMFRIKKDGGLIL
jgi:hypothetical protein